MATATIGTALTTTLITVPFAAVGTTLSPADLATINKNILDDQNVAHPEAWLNGTGGFAQQGLLYVPNRGVLKVLPGDYVAYDPATGFPYLISAAAAAGASWVHS